MTKKQVQALSDDELLGLAKQLSNEAKRRNRLLEAQHYELDRQQDRIEKLVYLAEKL